MMRKAYSYYVVFRTASFKEIDIEVDWNRLEGGFCCKKFERMNKNRVNKVKEFVSSPALFLQISRDQNSLDGSKETASIIHYRQKYFTVFIFQLVDGDKSWSLPPFPPLSTITCVKFIEISNVHKIYTLKRTEST